MIILGTNSIKDTGYDVANSLRFDDGGSEYLQRTPSSTGNRKTWTFSTWIKRSGIGLSAPMNVFGGEDGASRYTDIMIGTPSGADDTFWFKQDTGTVAELRSTLKLRDPSAWYHLVFVYDSTNGTADDRMKMYVNGVQLTSFVTRTNVGSNVDSYVNTSGDNNYVGVYDGSSKWLDGYLCETTLIDGTALTPTSFGEYNEDSPTIWQPIDVSGLTFGTNGFYLDFEDSSALGNDVSGNNNDFTVNNLTAIDQSTDTCTNNYCTPNPLWGMQAIRVPTFEEGNLKITGDGDAQHHQTMGTFAFNKGKWFWEAKFTVSADIGKNKIGIMSTELGSPQTAEIVDQNGSCVFVNEDGGDFRRDNTTVDQNSGTLSHNQIVSVALNMDDGEISIYRAGSLIVDALSIGNSAGTFVTPASVHYRDAGMEFNFGSPPYSESGGNSDGNGYGNFSMSVPSGYFAINSKNLAEYG